jgi:hypothetical protein
MMKKTMSGKEEHYPDETNDFRRSVVNTMY